MNQALSINKKLKEVLGEEHFVNPVLVFSRARVRFGMNSKKNVMVVGKEWLKKVITQDKFKYNSETVNKIVGAFPENIL